LKRDGSQITRAVELRKLFVDVSSHCGETVSGYLLNMAVEQTSRLSNLRRQNIAGSRREI